MLSHYQDWPSLLKYIGRLILQLSNINMLPGNFVSRLSCPSRLKGKKTHCKGQMILQRPWICFPLRLPLPSQCSVTPQARNKMCPLFSFARGANSAAAVSHPGVCTTALFRSCMWYAHIRSGVCSGRSSVMAPSKRLAGLVGKKKKMLM